MRTVHPTNRFGTYSTFQVSEVHNRGRDTALPCPYGNRRAIGVYFINVESAVVLNRSTNQLKIIDFSIASIFVPEKLIEQSALKNPQVLEGTLTYISPEQTGRMNRTLDYRTDYYSLGATLYEMLTRQLPFETASALELVHCHIAKQPKPAAEVDRAIPAAVSQIIAKLLAKNAEDRYQSAWGIKADLEECLN